MITLADLKMCAQLDKLLSITVHARAQARQAKFFSSHEVGLHLASVSLNEAN